MKPASDSVAEVTIESLSHDGRGITHIHGKTVFVAGALPGEQVSIQYRKRRSQYDEAAATVILTAAPERAAPACGHFGLCGGCSLQHIEADAQIKHKQMLVLQQLQRFAGITPETVLDPLLGPALQYRRRARLGVKYVVKKERLLIGFREKESRYLADLDHCEVLHPAVGQLIIPLRELIRGWNNFDAVPQIEVSVADNATALVFRIMTPLDAASEASLITFAEQHRLWIYLQPGDHTSIYQLYPSHNTEALHYKLTDFNLMLNFSPVDFIQINADMNVKMISHAMTLLNLNAQDVVLDLFCGLGNFSLPMATKAAKVVGVEGDKAMVLRAEHNAALNHLTNTAFHEFDLMQDFSKAVWASEQFTKILLDPPRVGAQSILPAIAALQASHIVYVSCDPATLARDAGLLVKDHGYSLKCIGVMDMFPQTTHVESIALFQKR